MILVYSNEAGFYNLHFSHFQFRHFLTESVQFWLQSGVWEVHGYLRQTRIKDYKEQIWQFIKALCNSSIVVGFATSKGEIPTVGKKLINDFV